MLRDHDRVMLCVARMRSACGGPPPRLRRSYTVATAPSSAWTTTEASARETRRRTRAAMGERLAQAAHLTYPSLPPLPAWPWLAPCSIAAMVSALCPQRGRSPVLCADDRALCVGVLEERASACWCVCCVSVGESLPLGGGAGCCDDRTPLPRLSCSAAPPSPAPLSPAQLDDAQRQSAATTPPHSRPDLALSTQATSPTPPIHH